MCEEAGVYVLETHSSLFVFQTSRVRIVVVGN